MTDAGHRTISAEEAERSFDAFAQLGDSSRREPAEYEDLRCYGNGLWVDSDLRPHHLVTADLCKVQPFGTKEALTSGDAGVRRLQCWAGDTEHGNG